MEKQHHHSQNSPQLDDHVKHALEFFGYVQGHQLIQQDQMPCRAHRQPLRHALYNAEEDGF